jgi:hypothetical protein
MDTIDRINEYRDKGRIPYTPVVVKKQSSREKSVLYVAIKATQDQCKEIKSQNTLLSFVSEDLLSNNIITDIEQIEKVLLCGDLSKFKKYSKLVYKFPLRKVDVRNRVEEQFRLYTKTMQQQRDLMLMINLCPTAELSWKSVLEKLGTNYGLLLKVVVTNPEIALEKQKLEELVKKYKKN